MADVQPRNIEASTPKSGERRRSQSSSSRGSQYECGCKRKSCHKSRKNEVFLDVPEKLNKTVEELFGECGPKCHGCACRACLAKKKKDETSPSNRDPGLYDSPVKDKSVQQKVGDDSIIDKDIQTKKLMSIIFDKDIKTGRVNSNLFNKRIQTNVTESLLSFVELPQEKLKSRKPVIVSYVTVSSQCICGPSKGDYKCFCENCQCQKCPDSTKESKSTTNIASKTPEMKCYCEKCACKTCPFSSKSGGDKSKELCKCGKCDCVNCLDPGKKERKGKGSGDPCPCPICQCKPGGEAQTGTNKCSCPECKCNPCVDPDKSKAVTKSSEPTKSAGECKCSNCTCKECQLSSTTPKVGGKREDDNKCGCIMGCVCIKCKFMSSGKPPMEPLPCGGDICKCKICQCGLTVDDNNDASESNAVKCGCKPCPYSDPIYTNVNAAPKKEDCKPETSASSTEGKACKCINECTCTVCSKQGAGGGKGEGSQGCSCKNCACPVCPKKGAASEKGGITTEASIDCKCNPCSCAVCSKKGAGGGKGEGSQGCSCKNCACPVCPKKGAASEKGGITTEASIDCKCNPCSCAVCSKKGAGGGKGEGSQGCSCKNCACPVCPKKGAASEKGGITTEASIDCKCNPCSCAVCSKKGAGGGKGEGSLGCSCKHCTCPVCPKKGAASEKGGITTEASIDCKCNPCSCAVCSKKGAGGGKGEGSPGCTCKSCTCPVCSKKGAASEKGGITTEASIDCKCNPCSCPVCSKKGKGDGGEKKSSGCTCKDCTCPICPKKGAASGKDGTQGGIVTEASIDCKCNPCSCPVCTKKGKGDGGEKKSSGCTCKDCTCPVCPKKGAASGKDGTQGGIVTEASIDCKCNPCSCPVCTKKGKGDGGEKKSSGCTCKDCTCPVCPKKGAASGKDGSQGGIVTEASIDCKCNPCTCAVCSKKGAGGGKGEGGLGCSCKNCTCPICSKKGAASEKGGITTEASIDCKCNPCSCPVCSKKGTGDSGEKKSSGCTCKDCTCPVCPKKGATSGKDGSQGCKCGSVCLCKECEFGGNKASGNDCKCNPCTCPVCSKKGKEGEKDSSGCKCSTCTCAVCSKKGAGAGKGEGSLGCSCKNCTCPVCPKKGAASEKGGSQGGITTEASVGCKCNPCSCPICSKKGKGDSGEKKLSGCTCKDCTCPVCPKKGAASGKDGSQGCKCSTCTCAVCSKKGADKGKGEGSLVCTCKICTCPVCPKKPSESNKDGLVTEATITCQCNPCSCPVCTKKGGGEQTNASSRQPCKCPPKSGKGAPAKPKPVCKCPKQGDNKGDALKQLCKCGENCSCIDCLSKKAEKGASGAPSRPPCKCPTKSGGAAAAKPKPVCECPKQGDNKGDALKQLCKCGDNCSCTDCLSKKGQKGASGGDKCLCKTCTCVECPKGGGANTGAGSKGNCKCPNCTCINCTMKASTKVYFCSTCTSDLPPSLSHITLGCPVEKNRNNSITRKNSHNVHSRTASPQKQGIGDIASKIEGPDPKSKFVNEKNKCSKCCSFINITDNRGKGDDLVTNPTVLREEVDYWRLVDGKEDPEVLAKKGHAHHKDRSKSKSKKMHIELNQNEMKEETSKSKHRKSRSKHRLPQFEEEIDLSTVPPFEIPKKLTCNSETCNCIICINKRAAKNSGTKSRTHSILKTKPESRNIQKVYRSVGSRTTPTKELPKNAVSPFEYISEKVCRDMTKKLLSEVPKTSSKELRKELPKNYYLDYIKDQLKHHSKDRASEKYSRRPETMEDTISQASHGFEDVSQVQKPLVKHASEFNQTMSDLNLAFGCLEKKGKVKDQLIEALSEALRNLGEDNPCEKLMNLTLVGEAPDYDRTEEQKLLENCLHHRKDRLLSAPPYSRLNETHLPTSADVNKPSKLVSDDSNLKEQQIKCIDYDSSSKELGESRSREHLSRPNEKLIYNVTCHSRDPLKQRFISNTIGDWTTGKKVVTSQLSKHKISATSTLNSSEYDSKSSIQLAINNLQDRCEAKDSLIKAAALELKKCISSNTLIKILNIIPEAMDLSMTKNENKGRDGSKRKYQECKDTIETSSKKTHGIVSSRSGKTAQVNLSGFEVTNVTRVTFNSLMVKWSLLTNKAVCGYDVLVNGKEKAKIRSSTRTSTMIHSLDLSSSVFIAVYAVAPSGRLEPPATAIFELQTKIR